MHNRGSYDFPNHPRKTSARTLRESSGLFLAGNLASVMVIAALATLACPSLTAWAQTAKRRSDHALRPEFRASFIPFGNDYRGGVSLATGWLAGSLGGAKRIVVSQLADSGSVKIFSSGSALDGGPSVYLQSPLHHDHGAAFHEMANFKPFDGSTGTRVATTSTTTGANLLASGVATGSTDASRSTSSSGRTRRRRNCNPCNSARSGPAKDRSPSFSAAISSALGHLPPRERCALLHSQLSTKDSQLYASSLKLPTSTP